MFHFYLIVMALFFGFGRAQYSLVTTYDHTNWLSGVWNFQTFQDPTSGFVQYQSSSNAESLGLVKIIGNQVYMGVDNTTIVPSGSAGRNSIWISSKETYVHYLLILDAEHIPANDCGSWPAFWSVNEANDMGEIDILEYSNSQDFNDMTLFTQNPCEFSPRHQTGTINSNNCDRNEDPAGCDTYGGFAGTGFNNVGGGVYATMWTSTGIRVFFWPRADIPSDISTGSPVPSTWGTPLADFQQSNGGCNIDENWQAQTIQIDTNFCGSSAGGDAWTSDPVCSKLAPTCKEYVATNPAVYDDAYWLINYVKVYQTSS